MAQHVLKFVTDMFCGIFSGDEKKSEYCDKFSQKSAKLAENIKKHAYDQSAGYFLRAWYDDGTPIGSQASDECNIELISQAFSVFAGLPSAMSFSAMRNAYEKLYDSDAKIFKLLSPPFSTCAKNPGYIKGYAPGIRENGGQYTHGAVWGCMAMIISSCNVLKDAPNDSMASKMLSDGVHALINLLPAYRCADRHAFEIYKCEPYVLCGDIYAGDNPGTRRLELVHRFRLLAVACSIRLLIRDNAYRNSRKSRSNHGYNFYAECVSGAVYYRLAL